MASSSVSETIQSESQGLEKLRELVEEESRVASLRCPTDDTFLVRFLRAKKGDPESAFKSIQAYYKLRQSKPSPDFLERLHPSSHASIYGSKLFSVLKDRDALGRPIIIMTSRNFDSHTYTVDDLISSLYLLVEEVTSYEDVQRNGIVLIGDHGGMTYTQMTHIASQLSIKKLKTIMSLFQGAFPARYKGFHVVNPTYVFHLVFKLARTFMSQKMKSRIHPHRGNIDDIFDTQYHMSRDILPKSFGGKIPDDEICDMEFMKRFMEKDPYYKEMSLYGYKKQN